jgi:hypothetical protein
MSTSETILTKKKAQNLKLRRDSPGLTQQNGADREILSELGMNDSAAYSFSSDIIHTGRAYKEVSSSNESVSP